MLLMEDAGGCWRMPACIHDIYSVSSFRILYNVVCGVWCGVCVVWCGVVCVVCGYKKLTLTLQR